MRICEVKPHDGSECNSDLGGVVRLAAIERSNVTSVTINGTGQVTAVGLVAATHFSEWVFNDNNTANLIETPPTRETSLIDQTITAQFSSVSLNGVDVGDSVNQCCDGLVVAVEYANGQVRWLGIEWIDTVSPMWRFSIRRCRAFVGTDSGTLETKGNMPITINAGAQYLAPFSANTFLMEDILAL